ncbi:MAG: DUF3854 domain-containing protein [Anaerolineales bacterium]|nr:DUF3854 domain-containing protein [Anaerolineales bacterium]
MLKEESGISDEVIEARGYKSIPDRAEGVAELQAKGFAPSQQRVPGLLIPLYTTDGGNGLYVYRPDNPRVIENRKRKNDDGTYPQKVIKYEQPKGEPIRLDCPPSCQSLLANPTIPLFATEGQKKSDALASRGACAIALTGVWNFKGTNKFGGKTFLADWDYVALNGRQVYIVFDSDVMQKTGVRQALERLTEHLQRKGATVAPIYLPNLGDGKTGVDDWFVATGKTLDDLVALATAPRLEPQPAPDKIELLDEAPLTMTRPLALLNGRSYLATWCYVRVTKRESRGRNGEIVRHEPPLETTEQRLFIMRDDGLIFGDDGDHRMQDLGFISKLPEIPTQPKILSTASFRAYRAGQRPHPTIIFKQIVACISRFMSFDRSLADQQTMSEMLACYIIATYFLDAFTVAGFLWPNGDRGSGKTQLLIIVARLAYLGQVVLAGGSFASLRDMADYGATLAFDDAENLSDPRKTDPDKRTLLLAGNRRGNTVSLKELVGKEWKTRHVNTFSFRLFSATRLPDNILASRTIIVPLIRTLDREKANADPSDETLWPYNPSQLVDDLWCLGLAHLPEMKRYETAVNQEARLTGRNLEPWRAILAVAYWLSEAGAADGLADLWPRLEQLSWTYQNERPELETQDLTSLVIRALCRAVRGKLPPGVSGVSGISGVKSLSNTPFIFLTAHITDQVRAVINEEESDFDSDWATSRRIGRVLGKMRLEQRKEAGTGKRGWSVTWDDLERWTATYGIDLARAIGIVGEATPHPINATNAQNATNATDDLLMGMI